MIRNSICVAIATILMATLGGPASATIYGTMSNFDVFNDTPQNASGAELALIRRMSRSIAVRIESADLAGPL